ncbi:hypothetical protein [Alkalicoccus luteus]|uniref:Uncharacterized protein n=1 Tax=Alkalicoccus luteus TaxID=1237094 RepID=A0A969PP60_9BACI|nr:hypothetical protein [Alkalicoccus luteus]NJP37812.1 hypothetical protein [Alkalicoccus luteus]
MQTLPPSFLGKKVYMDGEKKQYYVVKYEDKKGKRSVDVLLFEHENPVIFGSLDYTGRFLDSFYLSNRTTKASGEAVEQFRVMQSRRKQHRMTQDDLKDALKSEDDAKKKNKKIVKLLLDEHLEDIKNGWPSRLIALQREEDGAEDSLIMNTLLEATGTANPKKTYEYLKTHRLDDLVPTLGFYTDQHPELIEKVSADYFDVNKGAVLEAFLQETAGVVPMEKEKEIEQLLVTGEQIDQRYGRRTLKSLLRVLSRRVKQEKEQTMKEWLYTITVDKKLKQAIVQSLKK